MCKKVGHRTMDCPSKRKLTSKLSPISKLSVSRMTMQKSEQKEPHTKALQTEVPGAKKPHTQELHVNEKPLIVSSSSLM